MEIVLGAFQLNASSGNIQKLKITGNMSLSILSDPTITDVMKVTLLVQSSGGSYSISFGSNFTKPSGSAISLSTTSRSN